MEIERLQVVLELESSAFATQLAQFQNQIAGMSTAANSASKSMTSSFGGMTNVFANMGFGSVMSKNIKNSMQEVGRTTKSSMENMTFYIGESLKLSMKDLEQLKARVAELRNNPIEITTKLKDGTEGTFYESFHSEGGNEPDPYDGFSQEEMRAKLESESAAFKQVLADNMGTIIPQLEQFKSQMAEKQAELVRTDAVIKAAESQMPASQANEISQTGVNRQTDSDDDVPMLTQMKASIDAMRSELSKMAPKADGTDNDKADDNAFKNMNSIMKNISEDTAAIRARMASGLASSVPAVGPTVAAGAAGGAVGGGIGDILKKVILAAGVGYIIKDSIKSAMDSVESDSMFNTVFGGQAAGMKNWSEGAGTGQAAMYSTGAQAGAKAGQDLGLDPVQLRENAAYLYSMTTAMGLASAPARQMSQDLSMLANDMASFYNISSEEAFTKLRAGISGETEGLKALGIVVSDSVIKQYAYTHGIAKQGQELSESQKALARYNVIMNSTSMAQGDLARTISSPANQLRVLRTNLELVKRSLGEAFLPIVAVVLPLMNSFMRGLNTVLKYVGAFMRILFGKPATDATGGTKALAAGYSAVGDAATAAGAKAEKAKGSLMGFDEINSLSMSSPSGGAGGAGGGGISVPEVSDNGVFEEAAAQMDEYEQKVRAFLERAKGWVPILAGVAGAFGLLWTAGHWGKLTEGVGALAGKFGFLKPLLSPVSAAMKALGTVFTGLGTGPIVLIVAAIASIIAIIVDLWKHSDTFRANMIQLWDTVKNAFVTAWEMIWQQGIKPLIDAIINIGVQFYALYERIRPAIEVIITVVAAVVGAIVAALALFIGMIVTVFTRIVAVIGEIIAAILYAIVWIIDNWGAMWQKVGKFASDMWAGIKGVFSGIGSWFGARFSEAWSAIKGAFSSVGGFFGGIWDTIKSKFTSVGKSIGDAVGGAFKLVINGILGNLEWKLNSFVKLLNGAIGIINKIPGVNISAVKEFSIPRLAKGGIIDSPTVAMVGEAGKEAVIPLENNLSWINELASKINGQGGGGSDRPVEVILQIGSTTMGRVVIDSVNKLRRQEGVLALNI